MPSLQGSTFAVCVLGVNYIKLVVNYIQPFTCAIFTYKKVNAILKRATHDKVSSAGFDSYVVFFLFLPGIGCHNLQGVY